MKKAERQQKIKEIITSESIERQEDLVKRLNEMGLRVTQATISRDIKEMQLVKIPAEDGGYRYDLPTYHRQSDEMQLMDVLQDSLEQLKVSDRFIAMTVHPGNGPVVAVLLRRVNYPTIFTTIGDDASVLIVCVSAEAAKELCQQLKELANQ
ncbi:arginine repressor [Limosilactobacillus sp.]|jgi:transcriptional regulator of arginine metabolism|uniref:arginine repressor n=1 Tax=Limosilactobacillus sp. TaxID=2773925 RepID=UPI0025BA26C9|nr:ArgR family transcriptional regulator [Limosilactobacillus sp.]MCH3923043.1 ArgR family transcriptional regulator [Limosilactobacillus sp.]MCH3927726.1 ArgR family transcriptional regulator [Limosilactobacillus sp.]